MSDIKYLNTKIHKKRLVRYSMRMLSAEELYKKDVDFKREQLRYFDVIDFKEDKPNG